MTILQHRKAQNMKFGKQGPRTGNQFTSLQDGLYHINSFAMLIELQRKNNRLPWKAEAHDNKHNSSFYDKTS